MSNIPVDIYTNLRHVSYPGPRHPTAFRSWLASENPDIPRAELFAPYNTAQ
jgi:hypothetical protein